MKLKSAIKKLYNNTITNHESFVKSSLCGVNLNVVSGTIRSEVDQDDAWWFYLSKNHENIYDIGCNIGYTSLLALIQNPDRKIVLIDPNKEALQIAAKNILNNNLGSRASFLNTFISDKLDDTIKFYTVGSGAAGSMYASHAETAASLNSFLKVKTLTLDYLLQFYDFTPDLVKIDVEGAETLVMEGAYELAKVSQCAFFIEMHDLRDLPISDAIDSIIRWCKKVNYKVWYLKTCEELKNSELVKNRGKCHILLLPKDQPYPDYLINIPQRADLPSSI